MRYLLFCCFDEKRWDALPEAQRDAIMRDYGALLQSLGQSGQHLATGKLQPTAAATTVRSRNGKPVVIDGPFAETKEQLGGYHLIECRDLDEAIAIAKRIPTLPYGGAVEVRALES
ncbi:MAG: YciI family protein [Burkholderiales bacterium]